MKNISVLNIINNKIYYLHYPINTLQNLKVL